MSREIKFKQPIFVNNKFHHWHYWGFIDGSFIGPDGSWVAQGSLEFTGLKDKNGKEIYEGDVIKECSEGQSIWQDFKDEGGCVKECPIGVVEWDVVGFNIRQVMTGLVELKNGNNSELHLSKYDGQFEWSLVGGDIEIIGNIYQNPRDKEKR